MLLGDWNMSPEQLSTCGWEVPGYSQYATPGDTAITCRMGQGTMIDYGVVSQALKHGMVTRVEHNVPTSPHYGVVHSIRTDLCHCLLYTSPSPRDRTRSRMPSSA